MVLFKYTSNKKLLSDVILLKVLKSVTWVYGLDKKYYLINIKINVHVKTKLNM